MTNIEAERDRILGTYKKRASSVPSAIYAPWQADVALSIAERKYVAASILHDVGAFPVANSRCLEIGFGTLGWLGDLIGWGVAERSICGIDLSDERVAHARAQLPLADRRTGDAADLPWDAGYFELVIASTVFTCILHTGIRPKVAKEIQRVLAPRGALLWYDFRFNNPRNPDVRCVTQRELKELFPGLGGRYRYVTLAPPLSRIIARRSWTLAGMLGSLSFLWTHLLAVLLKGVLDG